MGPSADEYAYSASRDLSAHIILVPTVYNGSCSPTVDPLPNSTTSKAQEPRGGRAWVARESLGAGLEAQDVMAEMSGRRAGAPGSRMGLAEAWSSEMSWG